MVAKVRQPLNWDKAKFVKVQLGQYGKLNLIYTVGTAQNVHLNPTHPIIGNSLARLLGQQRGKLKIKNDNNTDSDVNIVNIVVGRKAIL